MKYCFLNIVTLEFSVLLRLFFLIFSALETVFGSLYLDEVVIEPKCVVSVLATATLFQLDELINRCAEVMSETVNAEVRHFLFD